MLQTDHEVIFVVMSHLFMVRNSKGNKQIVIKFCAGVYTANINNLYKFDNDPE